MFIYEENDQIIPITVLTEQSIGAESENLPTLARAWVQNAGFQGKAGEVCLLPDQHGHIERVWVGRHAEDDIRWVLADLPSRLPAGDYRLENEFSADECAEAAIGWGLGCYRFEQFLHNDKKILPRLYLADDDERIPAMVEAVSLVRNLVNMPANLMMPQDLEEIMGQLAEVHGADMHVITGNALLEENFPTIHAVGRASVHAPRLLELNWGDEDDPLITLVGKGVCFDSGGLDIKSASNMRYMKKDMGGAAHALGLAKLIMQLELPVSLQVLIPAVDNAISGDAFRPGDILTTRSGKTVEVDNTDAEGRLILCDALTYAAEFDPDVMIDFATLTGAARVALGTEIPVFFTNNRDLMQKLQVASATSNELIWNLPLHKPYLEQLSSHTADLLNSGGRYGGAITAALFLDTFVPKRIPWVHFDIMAWNLRSRPGRPIGGEAMGLMAAFEYIEANFDNGEADDDNDDES